MIDKLQICLLCLLIAAVSCTGVKQLAGNWAEQPATYMGTIDRPTFPELMSFKNDSIPLVRLYYNQLDLYSPDTVKREGNQLEFAITHPDFNGTFNFTATEDALSRCT